MSKDDKLKDAFNAFLIISSSLLLYLWLYYESYGDAFSSIITFIVFFCVFIKILISTPKAIRKARLRKLLPKNGITCTGVITDIKKQTTSFGQLNGSKVFYRFRSNEIDFTGNVFFNSNYIKNKSDELEIGKPIDIVYLPNDPTISTPLLEENKIITNGFGE